MYKFMLEVDRKYSNDLRQSLEINGAKVDLIIRKGTSFPDVLSIFASSLQIIEILKKWYTDRKNKDKKFEVKFYKYHEIGIKGSNEIKNWDTNSIKNIKKALGE